MTGWGGGTRAASAGGEGVQFSLEGRESLCPSRGRGRAFQDTQRQVQRPWGARMPACSENHGSHCAGGRRTRGKMLGNRLEIRIGQRAGAGTQRALPSTAATQGDDVWRETGVGRSRSRKPVRNQCGGPGWRLAGAERCWVGGCSFRESRGRLRGRRWGEGRGGAGRWAFRGQTLPHGLGSAPLRGTIILSDAHLLSGFPEVKPLTKREIVTAG